MDTHEQKRIDNTNHERQALASSHGWGFTPDDPELLTRWPIKPFTEIGDKRLAFGVVSGSYGGVWFTAFDYHRRPKVTHIQSRYTGKVVNSNDTINIDTFWVITLPAPLPWFQIFDSSEPVYDLDEYPRPQTQDNKINRSFRLVDTDPQVAVQLLTPHVTALMKEHKLYNWAAYGSELVCVKHPIFGRVKPEELVARVAALSQLIAALPPHLWQQSGAEAPEQQAPQQQAPQPPPPPLPQPAPQYQQPHYQQPQYQQPHPQYQQPQYPQPQYPPPQPQYPQPQYPQPHYPQPGHPQPQYPPPYPQQPHGYPGQQY